MAPTLLIITIIAYILSLMLALMLMIVSKHINERWRKRILVFHLLFLIIYFVSFFLFKSFEGIAFMIFFCAGIAIAGIVLRSQSHLLLKIYYSLFLCSVFIFLYSPSLLFTLLAQQKFPDHKGTEFLLKDNYYLVKQQSMLNINNVANYKIVKRTGKFNKTLARDVSFQHAIDSIKTIMFDENGNVVLRGYFYLENNQIDSLDNSTDLKK